MTVLREFWPYFTAIVGFLFSVATSIHAIVYKRDSRASVAWVGLIWLVPFIGSILYILLGVNRIRRRVAGQRGHESSHISPSESAICSIEALAAALPDCCGHLIEMARLGSRLTQLGLLKGNSVAPLYNGDEAYPAMIDAIANAERTITLTSYIFDDDPAGRLFVDALAEAVERGVEAYVLIDSVGARYSFPPITHVLRKRGVRVATFMPSYQPWVTPFMNLRNHRKTLVADGRVGFTGGMNIRGGCVLRDNPQHPTRDTHFRVTGPVVQELQATFVEDWSFTTGEVLAGEAFFPELQESGDVMSRIVPDGPDKDLDKMRMTFHGALSVAKRSVRIMTPYFLPDNTLITALNTCALRGVTVDIVLPAHNNLIVVAWAAAAQLWQVLEWGCRVWASPPPFDHSKILVVDDAWSLIGSANWDPRSLRLNFELGLECYSVALATELARHVDSVIATARPVTLDEVNSRPFPVKLRDGIARLGAPYL